MAVEDTTVSSLASESGRPATVLFADVSDSTRLYETLGDKIAHGAIGGCIDAMKRATIAAGGRVVKTIGDEVMAIFRMPDAAAAAAASGMRKIAITSSPMVFTTRPPAAMVARFIASMHPPIAPWAILSPRVS